MVIENILQIIACAAYHARLVSIMSKRSNQRNVASDAINVKQIRYSDLQLCIRGIKGIKCPHVLHH